MGKKRKSSHKIRVQFEKNRQKRVRNQNLTKQSLEDLDQVADMEHGERLSGKGSVNRYRTILTDEDGSQREIDESAVLSGRVLKCIGANHVVVQSDRNHSKPEVFTCTVRRVVRTLSRDSRNPVVAGDHVKFLPVNETEGVIERVEPRDRTLSRGSRREAHVIVSNVDQAVIVASVDEPVLKPGLIDRFLCSTEKGQIRAIICLNKIDLGDRVQLQRLVGQYARLGYPVVMTDAVQGEGIDELRRLLIDKETVFTGQSGVGKSSLLNAIQPGLWRDTGEVSGDTNKGRHTTRVTELIPLEAGGWVVDTPGIRQLELWDVAAEEVEGLFIEFRPHVSHCRFPDCSHTHETQCGVKSAVERGQISRLRYKNFLRIVSLENRHVRNPAFEVDFFDDQLE
ncbi:putative ribosome biogenesis GTPase RsgA [Thalassoglobus neptunius]|uniref:Small ribosomal subunit biogenesis GTPase RsgA n=1 Tax=Thalassoglobus neptunius TaxID=1938619 RepID=A0A5C5WZV6_9PLAN|nr:ribosome small subunit-dependent GTPase A [Thalassoglobus neptunius]TWT55455.1 putative ribosome biogenesis GTPase RsgA [Thalassoglobus neptunius]